MNTMILRTWTPAGEITFADLLTEDQATELLHALEHRLHQAESGNTPWTRALEELTLTICRRHSPTDLEEYQDRFATLRLLGGHAT
jgi:predicted metal-binding protein